MTAAITPKPKRIAIIGAGGRGEGFASLIREWPNALHTRDDSRIVANAQESLRTHTIVFAAEKSRLEQRTVELAHM